MDDNLVDVPAGVAVGDAAGSVQAKVGAEDGNPMVGTVELRINRSPGEVRFSGTLHGSAAPDRELYDLLHAILGATTDGYEAGTDEDDGDPGSVDVEAPQVDADVDAPAVDVESPDVDVDPGSVDVTEADAEAGTE